MDRNWEGTGFNGTVQDVPFTGRRFDYRPGFYVKSLTGLSGGGRVTTRGPAGRAGVLAVPGARDTARSIQFTGFAWAPTPTKLAALIDQFQGILVDEEDFARLWWEDLGDSFRTWVQRDGIPTISRRGSTGFADYQLSLSAPDQRVYGNPLGGSMIWGQSVPIINRGRYPAPVTINVRGSRPSGYDITGPNGRRVTVTRPLVAGVTHSYDADHGILTVDNVIDATGVTRSDMLEIPRGRHLVTVSAGAEIQVRGFDTYAP